MNKHRRILTLLLAFVMLLTVVAPLSSCGDGSSSESQSQSESQPEGSGEKTSYSIEVRSVGGMKLSGIMCYVHGGENDYTVARAETDENGIATFDLPVGDYTVELDGVQDGYVYNDRYTLSAGGTVITLATELRDENTAGITYEVGDIVCDYTLTTVDGETVKLSEILEEKKLVILNFWYTTCTWCIKEFPYMNAAYDRYSDEVEILAINDYAIDSLADVENFLENTIALSMPVIKTDGSDISLAQFWPDDMSRGYPTSVFIDRYGMIAAIEQGGIVNEKVFTNAFDYFTSSNYKQAIVESIHALTPIEKPDIEMPTSDEISAVFDKGALDITYYPEQDPDDAEYSWPFVIDGDTIRPSNIDKDNSYATLYADVKLEAGEALVFDYYSSTQQGYDILYVLINGKDMYSISGIQEGDEYKTCCTYVAEEAGTYTLSFCYVKDTSDYVGDDTVYLKNLRVVPEDQIPTETYIFRYAATNPTSDNAGYEKYVTVVLNENDGYYHVGDANGPLLLFNALGYTNFDSDKVLTERLYANTVIENGQEVFQFLVNGENVFNSFEMYCNYASNSQIYGYAPVTAELRSYLEAYTETYRRDVGKAQSENLWLQLCAYYSAYGTDGKQFADPTRGLSPDSAFEAKLGADNKVEYNRVIMPRGYLYKFVPTESGVYRITSHSETEVDGWVFTGGHAEWAKNGGNRILYAHGDMGERLCEKLMIDDGKGGLTRDLSNVSIVAYFEAGTAYYIDIAYYDVYEYGSFTFEIEYIGETFDYFIEASPGVFTTEGDQLDGSIIAGGIDVALCEDPTDERYGYYCEKRADGSLGYIVYADFYLTTNLFPSQSIQKLIELDGFNFKITAADREAKSYLDKYGEDGLRTLWGEDFESRWAYYQMDDIKAGIYHGDGEDYTEEIKEYEKKMLNEEDFPERQGCVPVDAKLAEILQALVDNYSFENVENSWRKLCYYYDMLGPDNDVDPDQGEDTSETEDIVTPPTMGSAVGNTCYGYDVQLLGDNGYGDTTFDPADNAGRITVINFWGVWCPYCLIELPYFDRIATEYETDVTVLAIHTDDMSANAVSYVAENFPNSNILFGKDDIVSEDDPYTDRYYTMLGGLSSYPMTVILDADGVIIASITGAMTYEQLRGIVDAALNESN